MSNETTPKLTPSIQDIMQRACPHIRKISTYHATVPKIKQDLTPEQSYKQRILLNSNENPYPPPSTFKSSIDANPWDTKDFNHYLQPRPADLLNGFAKLYSVRPEQLIVGNGSDEVIGFLIRAFCTAEDSILTLTPTFIMYRVHAELQGSQVLELPLEISPSQSKNTENFQGDKLLRADLPIDKIRNLLTQEAKIPKIVFLPNPLAPLGGLVAQDQILELLSLCAEKNVILAVDEAYAEFAEQLEPDNFFSFSQYLEQFPNLVIFRTMSKGYSLAGERVGCMLGAPELIQLLQKIQAPFPLSVSCYRYVVQLLQSDAAISAMRANIEIMCTEQRKFLLFLCSLPYVLEVFESASNFIALRVAPEHHQPMLEFCSQQGFILRSLAKEQIIRISIGTPTQMEQLSTLLTQFSLQTDKNHNAN